MVLNNFLIGMILLSDCNPPVNPPNGHFECTSNAYKESSICYLVCNAGYIVASKTSTVCLANAAAGTFNWDIQSSEFACVKPCHLVAGGLINGTKYYLMSISPTFYKQLLHPKTLKAQKESNDLTVCLRNWDLRV